MLASWLVSKSWKVQGYVCAIVTQNTVEKFAVKYFVSS